MTPQRIITSVAGSGWPTRPAPCPQTRWRLAVSQASARPLALPAPSPTVKMAAVEKRRPAAPVAGYPEANRAAPGRGPAAESEDEFLRHSGVTDMLRAALLKVLEARPEEPLPFLARYFENLGLSSLAYGGVGEPAGQLLAPQQRIGWALWHLRLAHHSQRTAFNNNVSVAYECLSVRDWKKKPGLDGRTYSELLKRICRDGQAPDCIVAPLLDKIQCRDHEAVPFAIFRSGMLTCFVLLEFLARAGALYAVLDDSGRADPQVCRAVLDTLEEALGTGSFSVPVHYLEASSKLGPDALAGAMDKALLGPKRRSAMPRDEFLEKAAALFLAKVRPVD
ncbi:tubulin polyglutamylase complex subunit 1 [Ornithorhynchus anatinus]|uniref:tubulin polyglutamylase complex subunit 1 n=1 Tax=Ornithorhynchus anatinus TaxID=9258 RepID=UPI0010A8099E|nr:tubulin polyglutamylase complex subunit 1 [Ornithorhynchus anatinus]